MINRYLGLLSFVFLVLTSCQLVESDTPPSTPKMDATMLVNTGVASNEYIFSVNSNPQVAVVGYQWIIDGVFYATSTVTHEFNQAGSYNVSLTLTDSNNQSQQLNEVVTVVMPVVDTNDIEASLSATTTVTGTAPFIASLNASNSTSDLAISHYLWDFENDSVNDQQTATPLISHTYEQPGNYLVKVLVVDVDGNESSDTILIEVIAAQQNPIAQIDTRGSQYEIIFDASASVDPDGDDSQLTYQWLIEGELFTDRIVMHTFSRTGDFDVQLTVTDEQNLTHVISKTITVSEQNTAPEASFEFEVTGLDVSLDASASSDLESDIASYIWNIESVNYTGELYTYSFSQAGDYDVSLMVSDFEGLTHEITQTVTIAPVEENMTPTAVFEYTTDGLTVSLDASDSTDSDGQINQYQWLIEDGYYSGSMLTHTFANSGDFSVVLTVTDNEGAINQDVQSITVESLNVAPVASFVAMVDGLDVTFNASESTDDDGSIVSYQWLIEGTTYTSTQTHSHTFMDSGTYSIELTVMDDFGDTHTVTDSVVVEAGVANQLPVPFIYVGHYENAYYSFSGVNSYDLDGDALEFTWELSDGTVLNGDKVIYEAPSTASVEVILYASDGKDVVTKSVTINPDAVRINRPYDLELYEASTSYLQCEGCHQAGSNRPFADEGDIEDYDSDIRQFVNSKGVNELYDYPVDHNSHRGSGSITTDAYKASWLNLLRLVDADMNAANSPPVPDFEFSVANNNEVTFTSTSSDPENDNLTYEWDFGDFEMATSANVTHTFPESRVFIVKLTVSDGNTYKTVHKKVDL